MVHWPQMPILTIGDPPVATLVVRIGVLDEMPGQLPMTMAQG